MTALDGRQIGRKDKLLGAIGTNIILFTPFSTIGPPAESAYAVEPVGVDIKIPSPAVVVIYSLFIDIYNIILL